METLRRVRSDLRSRVQLFGRQWPPVEKESDLTQELACAGVVSCFHVRRFARQKCAAVLFTHYLLGDVVRHRVVLLEAGRRYADLTGSGCKKSVPADFGLEAATDLNRRTEN